MQENFSPIAVQSARAKTDRRGVTLIMVAAVLAILAAMATGFYSIAASMTRSATRYSDCVRAEMMAQGGIAYAVAQLREQSFMKTEDPGDAWYTVDYLNGARKRASFPDSPLLSNGVDDDGDGAIDNPAEALVKPAELRSYARALSQVAGPESDRFTLQVSDASSRININQGDNLAVLLDNLCRVIGPPLIAADEDALLQRRWADEGATGFDSPLNENDKPDQYNLYYRLYDSKGALAWDGASKLSSGRPKMKSDGSSMYGDGYAIAGYRARVGRFKNIEEVKNALTYVERNNNDVADDPLELMEIDTKFAILRQYITTDSWVDTNTVCVGKFEWYNDYENIAIDRDKSWAVGDLKGCLVAVINGHGAGQVRIIEDNGIDWIKVKPAGPSGFTVAPGPVSSYMIIAKEDALDPDGDGIPETNSDGSLVDDPLIDYVARPLCIHRSPININTASDKVLAALFMGINVQQGHPMAVGTNADLDATRTGWFTRPDPRGKEDYILKAKGLKRVPMSDGKLVYDLDFNEICQGLPPTFDLAYLNNFGQADPKGTTKVNEAHELALRVISARQRTLPVSKPDPDPLTADAATGYAGHERGAFKSWDDFYFRVVRPWDDIRSYAKTDNVPYSGNPARKGREKQSIARMIMAHFNSNTDLLKFNPNIEWIDRWGRNFTKLEAVMVYTPPLTDASTPVYATEANLKEYGKPAGAYIIRNYRYKSDELIDKSDMNRSTTEFTFDSGGIFEIESVGSVVNRNTLLAERKMTALVKVYSVWRESTQRQFVRGTIEAPGGMGKPGTPNSGQIVRDAKNVNDRLPLTTLPEPLVPLEYRIKNTPGLPNTEVVDTKSPTGLDAWGNPKPSLDVPDIVANKVLPANYDGQLVLATNTLNFDINGDKDTFLASFNGDLDTNTAKGNGREQAKSPSDVKKRVVDTCSLLGVINDTTIDTDPGLPANRKVYKFTTVDSALKGLDPAYYWNNVTLRMGDLRADGVHLTGPGVSGNDATLKYLYGQNKENFNPGSDTGNTISMWLKPSWHHADNRHHELFNGTNPGGWWEARACWLLKAGRYVWAVSEDGAGSGLSGSRARNNDLMFDLEGVNSSSGTDRDVIASIHGGMNRVGAANLPPSANTESPKYAIQPFRWTFVGARWQYQQNNRFPTAAGGSKGHWVGGPDYNDAMNLHCLKYFARPFIDTQANPDSEQTWKPNYFWTRLAVYGTRYLDKPADLGNTGAVDPGRGRTGQDVKWDWAVPTGPNTAKCFSINNLNYNNDVMIYRNMPDEGTYGVIDELKISSLDNVLKDTPDWNKDRVSRPSDGEQTLSRYYLPKSPQIRGECPTFTSQTLLQAMRGTDKTASNEYVTPVRVSWNVFTPRFMHENKTPQKKRKHIVRGAPTDLDFKGPFDFAQYNYDVGYDAGFGWKSINPWVPALGVDRLHPEKGKQSPYTRGVEVELLDGYTVLAGFEVKQDKVQPTSIFVDPDVLNRIGATNKPVRVAANELKYRVRFRYPVNQQVDPGAGLPADNGFHVDPSKHYLLDTPVFDDISIVYITRPVMLSMREVME